MLYSAISRVQTKLASQATFQSPNRQIKVEIANSNDPDHELTIAELAGLLEKDIMHWSRLYGPLEDNFKSKNLSSISLIENSSQMAQ